ncbi:MAG: T9SS type A sorting domain-containing protein [Niastella sp.]|nr:T9SS type A sorting domain-containing protein [Niastella sp.]
MKKFYISLAFILMCFCSFANYTTPGTGVIWNLNDLVANSSGDVSFDGSSYYINDTITISNTDAIQINTDETVKFAGATYIYVLGTLLINPPNQVLFTAQNINNRYMGIWIDNNSSSSIKKLTLEYANSLRLSDCSIVIDSCTFQYNSALSTFGNSAISLFRSNPVISNCKFLNNMRAAIQGGANISNAPKIIKNVFMGNNTLNGNVPQINLGATSAGTDTVKIIDNQILQASTKSGGIGFLPIGNVYAIISGNTIINNRYGITFNGGSNINSIISYNIISNNNTDNNPATGGSGIAFSGGAVGSPQNTIVTGNEITGNLWGITMQGHSQPNIGNLANSDTTDDGKNRIYNNTNVSTPNIALYNNSPEPISAQGNYWGTNDPVEIENVIFHQPDNAALGLVNFSNFILPVSISRFTAQWQQENIRLNWQTENEVNSDYFDIERSTNGQNFTAIARLGASGHAANTTSYSYLDKNLPGNISTFYYRLKQVDNDGLYKRTVVVALNKKDITKLKIESYYPGIVSSAFHLNLLSDITRDVVIKIINTNGKLLSSQTASVLAGANQLQVSFKNIQVAGIYFIQVQAGDFIQTIRVVKL